MAAKAVLNMVMFAATTSEETAAAKASFVLKQEVERFAKSVQRNMRSVTLKVVATLAVKENARMVNAQNKHWDALIFPDLIGELEY